MQRRPRTAWWKVGAGVVVAIGLLGVAVLSWRAARVRSTVSAEPVAPLTRLCRTVSTQSISVAQGDRIAVLPDGSLVLARKIRDGLKLERETAQGPIRFAAQLPSALPSDFRDLHLRGVTLRGRPAVFVHVDMDALRGATVQVWLENGDGGISRTRVHPSAVVATSFGESVVAVATASFDDPRSAVIASRVGASQTTTIEEGDTAFPAVAAAGDRLAVVYRHGRETHFALLDRDIQRVGDVKTVVPYDVQAAVAFAGETATVFWTNADAGKTRLTFATFTAGESAFSAAKVALDDPLVSRSPVAARLPDGSFAVAWVISSGGPSTLRISPVGAGGALTGPSNVAIEASFDDLTATPTEQGVALMWRDGAATMKVARVACGAAR